MIRNYLSAGLRYFNRNRLFTFLNVGGLAIGLAACLLILLFVRYETSFENWLPGADRVYRAETTFNFPGRDLMLFSYSPGPLRLLLEKEFPSEIEAVTRFDPESFGITRGDTRFRERVILADKNFFEVFDLPMVAGVRDDALARANTVLMSESMAAKYFGPESPVGQTLQIDDTDEWEVAGVFRDLPSNTHLKIDFISWLNPLHFVDAPWVLERWGSVNLYTYFKLRPGASISNMEARISQALNRNASFAPEGAPDATPSDHISLDFLSVPDIHLGAKKTGNMRPGGDKTTVMASAVVALLILAIASINFTNLATARAIRRSLEVGIRKVVGAGKAQLVAQFLGEAVIIALLALVLATVMAELALPWYEAFLQIDVADTSLFSPLIVFSAILFATGVGLAGGIYPAFYLSAIAPHLALSSGTAGSQTGKPHLRNALVIFQFAISIALIIATGTIYSQTEYARNVDAGYDRNNLLVMRGMGADKAKSIQIEIDRLPGVLGSAFSSDVPPLRNDIATRVELPDVDDSVLLERSMVDPDYLTLLGVEPVAGRLFSRQFMSEVLTPGDGEDDDWTQSIVVNERALSQLGISNAEDAIGITFRMGLGDEVSFAQSTIIGVIPDIQLRSVRRQVSAMVFFPWDGRMNYLAVRLQDRNQQETIAAIDRIWRDMAPEAFISRDLVNNRFGDLYIADQRAATMFSYFAIFAVLVSCLGLFGLASFNAERRTREIGIRKVLGATVRDIVQLLTWQFGKPVMIANIIAWPAAWYFLQDWLSGFAYRIDLSPLFFAGAGVAALVIAWITVGAHALRAARANPVHALRHE